MVLKCCIIRTQVFFITFVIHFSSQADWKMSLRRKMKVIRRPIVDQQEFLVCKKKYGRPGNGRKKKSKQAQIDAANGIDNTNIQDNQVNIPNFKKDFYYNVYS